MRKRFLAIAAAFVLAAPDLQAKSVRIDPDMTLIHCAHQVGIKSAFKFSRTAGLKRDLPFVEFEAYQFAPSVRMSKGQKARLKACYEQSMAAAVAAKEKAMKKKEVTR